MGESAVPAQSRIQIDSLTTLRGVLAVWVVGYHFADDLIRLFPAANSVESLLRSGHFAVPGFFILSGFVLAHNYASQFRDISTRNVLRFWTLRLARIYPVHLATLLTLAALIAAVKLSGYTPTGQSHSTRDVGYSSEDFVLNFFLVHAWVPEFQLNWNYPSWSISSEWFAYLLFPFLARWVLPRITNFARAWSVVIICLAATVAFYLQSPFPFRVLVWMVPMFLIGMAFHTMNQDRGPAAPSALQQWLPNLFAVIAVEACFVPGEVGITLLLVSLCGLVWALVRVADHAHRVWLLPGMVYLGEVSYSLYMTHALAQRVLYEIIPTQHYEQSTVIVKLGVAFVYFGVVGAWCLATYYLIEQPARRWVQRKLRSRACSDSRTPASKTACG